MALNRRYLARDLLTFTTLLVVSAIGAPQGIAQYAASPAGQPPAAAIEAAKAQARAAREQAKNKKPEAKPDEKKSDESKDKEKKADAEKSDEKKSDGPVKRSNEPPRPPDPREFDARPNANGRVTFSFHGQPWADVLEWLAKVSGLSLDWRELPGDYLNLTTQRSYTLPEARDLINRHLQARGYTLLLSGEVLSVFKLDKLDPSLVPRITEEDLYDRQPHDIVKLSLETPPGIDPKQAVEDVKQALSPNAKVMPLAATKRLLLIDTVANLRMVSALLNAERLEAEGRPTPREFILEHVQASEVIDILYVILGLDPNSRPSQMELQMQQQKMQLMQQLAQRGKDVMQLLKKDGPPVYLAYNRQRNSVLANAPPEQMRIIERTIDSLDVPAGGAETSMVSSPRTFESYRLKTIEPQAVIGTLRDIGNLSPRAELQGDNASKTLFARATPGDHESIQALIDQLDGAETIVEVFWLRRLPAEAVAGSIEALIINKPKKKKKNNRPYYFFSYRNNEDDDDEPETILRVDADVENNRLIVRGTPQQMEEVRDLLRKLGEPIDDRPDRSRVRVLDALPEADTAELLRRLEKAWPAVGADAELVLPPEPPATDDEPVDEEPNQPATEQEPKERTAASKAQARFRLLATGDPQPRATVGIDGSGRLVLRSDDPEVLNRLEALVEELAPPPPRYTVFPVKHRNPEDLVDNLKSYFEEFLPPEDEQVLDWWGRVRGVKTEDDAPVRLSRRRPLRFLPDDRSSSILVANATPQQLQEIEQLLSKWDRESPIDRVLTRRTTTVKLRYAKASAVVKAIKDVYREMLGRRDREFDTEEKKAPGSLYAYLTRISNESGDYTEPAYIAFDGMLSLGADDEANVVIVSARDEIFDSVMQTIDDLDQRARPTTTVRVRSINGGIAMTEIRAALMRALGEQSEQRSQRPDSSNEDRERRREDRRRRR